MGPRGYLTWLAATILSLSVLAIIVGVVVDPYRMFGTAPIPGWTELKPRAYEQTGIAKTYQLERVQPNTILLGNSRVEIGFDPESKNWPAAALPVFNAAEAGRDLFIAHRLLQHAIALRPPKTVIVGLDILDFLDQPSTDTQVLAPPGPDERRLLVMRDGSPNRERSWQMWKDRFSATLTIDALFDDVTTLIDQDPAKSVTMTPFGFNPLHEYQVFAQRSGYYGLFAQKNAVYEAQYRHYPAPDFSAPERIANFRYLVSLIRDALQNHCQLILFIHPYHADYLEMLHRVRLWSTFEAWKRALVRVVEAEGGSQPGAVTLLDFSDYDEFSTEHVPPVGDLRTQMHWYWEAGHYKRELGDRMLLRMYGRDIAFGRLITSTSIEADLEAIRESRSRFFPQAAQLDQRGDPPHQK